MAYTVPQNNIGIFMDDRWYNVGIKYKTLTRSFNIVEGRNSFTALSGKKVRDILGTSYSYDLEVLQMPDDPQSFYEFYDALQKITDFHIITLPFGETQIKFDAIIETSSNVYTGKSLDGHTWGSMKINVKPYEYNIVSKGFYEVSPPKYDPETMEEIKSDYIYMDGKFYHLNIEYESLSRTSGILYGSNSAITLTGRNIRDVIANILSYKLTINQNPAYKNEYDSFYNELTQPVPCHSFVFPYNNQDISFLGSISSGTDTYLGYTKNDISSPSWSGLELTIDLYKPIFIRMYINNIDIGNIQFHFMATVEDPRIAYVDFITLRYSRIQTAVGKKILCGSAYSISHSKNINMAPNYDILSINRQGSKVLNKHIDMNLICIINGRSFIDANLGLYNLDIRLSYENEQLYDVSYVSTTSALNRIIYETTNEIARANNFLLEADQILQILNFAEIFDVSDLDTISYDETLLITYFIDPFIVLDTDLVISSEIMTVSNSELSLTGEYLLIELNKEINLYYENDLNTLVHDNINNASLFNVSYTSDISSNEWVMPIKTDGDLKISYIYYYETDTNTIIIR